MARKNRSDGATICIGLAATLVGVGSAWAEAAQYPSPGPMSAYRMASQADEVALARSAAPPSISNDAEVMTMGAAAYEVTAKGTNGYVCLVERSWANEPASSDFWNFHVRGPLCFNPAAVRTVMPTYLERSKWVLAGASKDEVVRRTKADIASGKIPPPANGAMSYMMSKGGVLGDKAGHWHPHLMFFMPRNAQGDMPDWGADLAGSPVLSGGPGIDTAGLYFVPLAKWSDGTSAMPGM